MAEEESFFQQFSTVFLLLPIALLIFTFQYIPEDSILELQEGNFVTFLFAGIFLGLGYFMLSELKNADDNRSYTANILTDVIAFIGAGWIILRGYALDEGIIGFIGSAIFTIHLMQLIYKRGIPNIPF